MNMRFARTLVATSSLVMMGNALAAPWHPPEYEVTAIIVGFQCGDHLASVSPYALNEAGDVAGIVHCFKCAFRWTADTGLELIPMPPQTSQSAALAISGSKVVGTYSNPDLELGVTGFLYDFETNQFTSLGTLPGGNWSQAHAINSKGEIVGFWGDVVNGPSPLAFIWRDGEMIDLGPSIGGANNRAFAINESGAITGWWQREDNGDRIAFLWDDGKVTSLGPIPGGFTSEGWTINNLQDVAGGGRVVDPRSGDIVKRAFAWIDGQMILLGTLPGFPNSTATGINNERTVVGYSQSAFADAFVWKDGEMAALDDLIPANLGLDFSTARVINQAGQIVAGAQSF